MRWELVLLFGLPWLDLLLASLDIWFDCDFLSEGDFDLIFTFLFSLIFYRSRESNLLCPLLTEVGEFSCLMLATELFYLVLVESSDEKLGICVSENPTLRNRSWSRRPCLCSLIWILIAEWFVTMLRRLAFVRSAGLGNLGFEVSVLRIFASD